MKKLVASMGLVAVGATGLQAAYAPGLTRAESSKPWSISASLRGFYDDNYTASPSDLARDSFGVEVSPRVSFYKPLDRTLLGASYAYSMKYYADRDEDPIDHQHEFIGKIDHKFSERYSFILDENFVYAQEPEVIDEGTISVPIRTDVDTIRNRVQLKFRAEITEVFGLEPFYQNTWYNYSDDGAGSRSALLDRLEHLIGMDGRYRVKRDLVGLVGYQYGINDYTSSDPITLDPTSPDGDSRDSTSHYFYAGLEQALTSKLSASLRVGAQYTDYDNQSEAEWSPYVEGRGTYEYNPGSYFQIGFRHARNATDVSNPVPGTDDFTLDQETSTLYASVTHKITPRLSGSLLGQVQHGVYNEGDFDGDADNLFLVGINFEYEISRRWAAEVGYNYDRLDSDLPFRSFTRNRVYIGVRASY